MELSDIWTISKLISEDTNFVGSPSQDRATSRKSNPSEPGPTKDQRREFFGIGLNSTGRTDDEVIHNTLEISPDGDYSGEIAVYFKDEKDLESVLENEKDIVNSYGDVDSSWDYELNYIIVLSADPSKDYRGDPNDRGWPRDLPPQHGSGVAFIEPYAVEPRDTRYDNYEDYNPNY